MVKSTSIRVATRFRPINARERSEYAKEKSSKPIEPFECTDRTITSFDDTFTVTLDEVFGTKSTQEEVFEGVGAPVAKDCILGFNGTIFAYGQTGSGKTFSIFGPDVMNPDPELYGLIPRTADFIFKQLERMSDELLFSQVSMTMVEIYLEKLMDLIHPEVERLKLWDATDGVFVEGLEPTVVTNIQDVINLLQIAKGNRKVSFTKMNAESSRSHCVLTFIVSTTLLDGTKRSGKLNFGDLAGSEKTRKTGVTGDRLEEAKAINKSLSCLGSVMKSLVDGREHVNYRDSKLTFLLKDSLGGNCKTTLLTAASPHVYNMEETISTLRFAQRAKKIKTQVKQNEVHNLKALLKKNDALMARIAELEKLLKGKGVTTIMAETQSLKLSFQQTFEEDCDEEKAFRVGVLKEIRGLPDFSLTRVECQTLSFDPYTLDIVFHPTEFAPRPAEFKSALRNLFYGEKISSPLLCEAELVEEMDLALKKKYETTIADLEENKGKLEAEIEKLSKVTKGAERELMRNQFLFMLNHARDSDIAEMKKEWVSAKKKLPVMKSFLEKQQDLIAKKCDEARAQVSEKDPTLKKIPSPLDAILGLFDENADLRKQLEEAEKANEDLKNENSQLQEKVQRLKRFITGQEIEDGSNASNMFGKDPMTKLGSLFRFFSNSKENGTITKSLLETGLASFGVYLSAIEVDEVFERMDRGKVNEVDYNNFLEFMGGEHAAAHMRLSQVTLKLAVQRWMAGQWQGDIDTLTIARANERLGRQAAEDQLEAVKEQKVGYQDRIQTQQRAIEKVKQRILRIQEENALIRSESKLFESDLESTPEKRTLQSVPPEVSELEIKQHDNQIERLEKDINDRVKDIMAAENSIFQLDQRMNQMVETLGKIDEGLKGLEGQLAESQDQMKVIESECEELEHQKQVEEGLLSKDPDQEKLDPVTGLLNRYEFDYAVQQYMSVGNFLVNLKIDNFEKFARQHTLANKKLKQFGDVLKNVTRHYDDVYFYRVGNAQFAGVFLQTKMETVYAVTSKILGECETDTEFKMSVGLSPYEKNDEDKHWIERCVDSMSRSVYTRDSVIQTATKKSEKTRDPKLSATTFEDLDADKITIGDMLEQITKLESANDKLTEIYIKLRLQSLSGVISNNVRRTSRSIKELKARANMLQHVNQFDRKFILSHCGLYNIVTSLHYVFDHQQLPDFKNIQDRVSFIEAQERLFSHEQEQNDQLLDMQSKLALPEELFKPTNELHAEIKAVIKAMRNDAGRKSRAMQRELIKTAEQIWENFDQEKVGYLMVRHLDDFLDAIGVDPSNFKSVKMIMDRDREGMVSRVDFLLWMLSVEYDVELVKLQGVKNPYGFKTSHQDKCMGGKKQLVIRDVLQGGPADAAGIQKASRVLMVGNRAPKFRNSKDIHSAIANCKSPAQLSLQVISAAANAELANQGLTKFIILQELLKERPILRLRKTSDELQMEEIKRRKEEADAALSPPVTSPMSDLQSEDSVGSPSVAGGSSKRTRLDKPKASGGGRKPTISCQEDIRTSRSYKQINLGEKVQVAGQGGQKLQGQVKFIGKVHFAKDVMFGIETQGRMGDNDGVLDGLKYFDAGQKKGLFVKRNQIKKVLKSIVEQMESAEKSILNSIRSGNYKSYRDRVGDSILKLDLKKIDAEHSLLAHGSQGDMTGEARLVLHDLLLRGVNVNRKHQQSGYTPLILCARSGNVEMCELYAKKAVDLNIPDDKGWTPLMHAAICGHAPVVNVLCENDCAIDAVDKDGRSVMHHVAGKGMVKMFQLLMKRDPNPNIKDRNGQTPLMSVCSDGLTEMVYTILSYDVQKDVQDKNGKTALMLCASKANPSIVDALCAAKANMNLRDKNKRTALICFAAQGKNDLVQVLTNRKAKLDLSDKFEATALHYACSFNGYTDKGKLKKLKVTYDEVVKTLVKGGAKLDVTDKMGKTPLIIAATKGAIRVCEFLVQFGARTEILDSSKKTALQTACQLEKFEVANTLLITPNYADEDQFREKCVNQVYKAMGYKGKMTFVSVYSKGDIMAAAKIVVDFVDIQQGLLKYTENALNKDQSEEIVPESDHEMKMSVRYAGFKTCNGIYHLIGMSEQSPKYELDSARGTFQIAKRKAPNGKNNFWYVLKTDTRPNLECYIQKQDEDTPPLKGWIAGKESEQPCPTLIPGHFGHWFVSAEFDDPEQLEQLLAENVHIDLPDKDGLRATHLTAERGFISSLEFLLSNKADMNVKDFKRKETPLIKAARSGSISSYDMLMKYGCDSSIRNKRGHSAADIALVKSKCPDDDADDVPEQRIREAITLIAAANGKYNEIVYAMENGIDRQIENGRGDTLIQVAILNGHYNIANFILSRTVDDVPLEYFTEWFEAADQGDVKTFVSMNKNGVHVDLPTQKGRTALMTCSMKNHVDGLETLHQLSASPDMQDNDGRTALHLAAMAGKKDVCEILCTQHECDPNIQDQNGNTALHAALLKNKLHVARTILKNAQDMDFNLRNSRMQSILMVAVQTGSKVIVEYMLEKGASHEGQDELGRSALSLAIKSNFKHIAACLVAGGAQLSESDMDSFEDSWFMAVEEGNLKTMESLLLGKFDANRVTEGGATALMLAAQRGHTKAVALLLQHAVGVDMTDDEKNTAMHFACQHGFPEIVTLLCEAKASRTEANGEGLAPFDLATRGNHPDCAKALTKKILEPVSSEPRGKDKKPQNSQKPKGGKRAPETPRGKGKGKRAQTPRSKGSQTPRKGIQTPRKAAKGLPSAKSLGGGTMPE